MKCDDERRRRIAELNDALRQSFSGSKVVKTASIAALPNEVEATILGKVTAL